MERIFHCISYSFLECITINFVITVQHTNAYTAVKVTSEVNGGGPFSAPGLNL